VDYHQSLLYRKNLDAIELVWAPRFCDFHFHLRLVQLLLGEESLNGPTGPKYDSCHIISPQNTKATPKAAEALIELFMRDHLWLPVDVELYSLFFLLSRHSFCHHWHLWMKHQLQSCEDKRAEDILLVRAQIGWMQLSYTLF
jgi:hypothetical protein